MNRYQQFSGPYPRRGEDSRVYTQTVLNSSSYAIHCDQHSSWYATASYPFAQVLRYSPLFHTAAAGWLPLATTIAYAAAWEPRTDHVRVAPRVENLLSRKFSSSARIWLTPHRKFRADFYSVFWNVRYTLAWASWQFVEESSSVLCKEVSESWNCIERLLYYLGNLQVVLGKLWRRLSFVSIVCLARVVGLD